MKLKYISILLTLAFMSSGCATDSAKKKLSKSDKKIEGNIDNALYSYNRSLEELGKESPRVSALEFEKERMGKCKKELDEIYALGESPDREYTIKSSNLKFDKNPFQLKELYAKCEELSIKLTSKIAEVNSKKANESKEEDIKKYGLVTVEYKKGNSAQPTTSFSCSDSILASFQFKEAEDNNPIWFTIHVDGEEIKAHRTEVNIDKPASLLKGKTLTGKLDYILVPSPGDIEKKPNEFSTPGSFAFDSRKLILTTLTKLSPGKHEVALYHLRRPNITENASFTIECEDYSKSMYSQSLVKLNESGLAKVTFPTKNANPSILPQVTKKVTQYCQESDPACTVKLVRVLSGAEEIFGEKINGKWSKIYGKGYAVVAGIQNPDGSCDAMYGRYAKEYDYSAKEFVGDFYFQSSNSEDISCKNIK